LKKADVYFCIGTNMTECHPVAATRMKKALARGSKLIVADPRYIKLAEIADLYLPLRVGTDVALLLGMAHVIVRENLVDQKFIDERVTGMEEYIGIRQKLHARMGF
jgi:formate dehydrogenase major subunit